MVSLLQEIDVWKGVKMGWETGGTTQADTRMVQHFTRGCRVAWAPDGGTTNTSTLAKIRCVEWFRFHPKMPPACTSTCGGKPLASGTGTAKRP